MPLYEYQCVDCGGVTEAIQKFSDAPLSECPDCGGHLERLVSAPAIQFKGSGWYITDYARKAGNGDKKPADKAEAKSDSKSEPKPESKSTKIDAAKGGSEKST